jgi:hypothetical protein
MATTHVLLLIVVVMLIRLFKSSPKEKVTIHQDFEIMVNGYNKNNKAIGCLNFSYT